jgi:hypothetical protein
VRATNATKGLLPSWETRGRVDANPAIDKSNVERDKMQQTLPMMLVVE